MTDHHFTWQYRTPLYDTLARLALMKTPEGIELKPCPFCGETPTLSSLLRDDMSENDVVRCFYMYQLAHQCSAVSDYVLVGQAASIAKAWNQLRGPTVD